MRFHGRLAIAALLLLQAAAAQAAYSTSDSTGAAPKHGLSGAIHRMTHPMRHGNESRISAARAREIAKERVPGGRLQSHEMEKSRGHWVYSYDFRVPGKKGIEEVKVDARNGKVVGMKHESARGERHERQREAQGKHA